MTTYTFQLAGHLDTRWAAVFEGFGIVHTMSPDQQPITLLVGPVRDQAALYGVLGRLRDLGVTLTVVRPAELGDSDLAGGGPSAGQGRIP